VTSKPQLPLTLGTPFAGSLTKYVPVPEFALQAAVEHANALADKTIHANSVIRRMKKL
jgi:hypothetical protein